MSKNKLVSIVIVTKDRKKELIECLDSYKRSTYEPIEIIIVDNASLEPVKKRLLKQYPVSIIITNAQNTGAAEGRNQGLRVAKGEYILFSDDDAVADRDMIKQLVTVFEKNKKAGIVQPLIYDKQNPQLLQGAGHDINITNGRIRAWGAGEIDTGQYEGLRQIPMCGCIWMVKKEVFKKIGEYDKEYFIPYEDSDFSLRAAKAGYTLYCFSKAKAWHEAKKSTYVHPWIDIIGITSPERAFRISRNKIIFMKKHAKPLNLMFFLYFFLPAYVFTHSSLIIGARRIDIFFGYWKGVISGLRYNV